MHHLNHLWLFLALTVHIFSIFQSYLRIVINFCYICFETNLVALIWNVETFSKPLSLCHLFFFFVLDWSVSNAISVYFSFYLRYIFLIRVLWIGHIYEFWQTKTIYILIYLSIIKHRNIYTYKYIREILNVITREAWSLLHVQHKIVFEWHEYVTLS